MPIAAQENVLDYFAAEGFARIQVVDLESEDLSRYPIVDTRDEALLVLALFPPRGQIGPIEDRLH